MCSCVQERVSPNASATHPHTSHAHTKQFNFAKDEIVVDDKLERATLTLPSKLAVGDVSVEWVYTGVLNSLMKGFYITKHKVDGVEHLMASTQFQPADARRALPCWDEPLLKATFDVTLVVPDHLEALSCMEVVSTTPDAAKKTKTVKFATTPIMSTYLLAFAVGELEYVETTVHKVNSKEPTVLRVYTTAGKKEKAQLGLETAAKCLEVYENYFEQDYVLKKLDFLAVPDFQCGAMENWGLITFRESCLLCDEKTSFRARLFVALVVAHEIAHMWFGNLVTMVWWRELWLNEAFATFIEFDTIDKLHPEWKPWAQFIAEDYNYALTCDALLSSHPVEVDVKASRTEEIDEIFDGISYSKGCSLMRMLSAWIGKDAFRLALVAYIKKYSYANARTVDLWDAFEVASGKPVNKVMGPWTAVQGFPIVSVSSRTAADGSVELDIKQSRFLSARPATPEEDTQVWDIPMDIVTNNGTTKHLLEGKTCVVKLGTGVKWVKLNGGQSTVCRVFYSSEMLARLSTAIEAGALGCDDVAGIIGDLKASAQAGLTPATDLLNFISSCKDQSDVTVWSAISSAVGSVGTLLKGTPEKDTLWSPFMLDLFGPVGKTLGWEHAADDDDRRKQLRGLTVGALALHGDADALAEARKRFDAYLASGDETGLPSDLRGEAYTSLVRAEPEGSRTTWDALQARYEKHEDVNEQMMCLRALAKSKSATLSKEAIDYAFSGKVRSQSIPSVVASLCWNDHAGFVEFLLQDGKWSALYKEYGGFLMNSVASSLEYSSQGEPADKIEKWWATISEEERKCADTSMRQSLEALRLTAAYAARDKANVIDWLKKRN